MMMTERQKQERRELKARNLAERAEAWRQAFERREAEIRETREQDIEARRAAARELTRRRRRAASQRNIKLARAAMRGQRDMPPPEPISAIFWLQGRGSVKLVGGSHPKPPTR